MKRIVSEKTGKWLLLGGGSLLLISIVAIIAQLLPIYSMVGCVGSANCDVSSLDKRAMIVHTGSWFVGGAIVVMVAGGLVMFLAERKKK